MEAKKRPADIVDNEEERPAEPASKKRRTGFHRYRNGLLNVKPKGQYIAITKNNSVQSPLLRLPAEIRNKIFDYALGGRIWHLLSKLCGVIKVLKEQKHALALLAVCRQIYAETATSPFRNNTFKCYSPRSLRKWLSKQARARRDAITSIDLGYTFCDHPCAHETFVNEAGKLLPMLPALKCVRVEIIVHIKYYLHPGIGNIKIREKQVKEAIKSMVPNVQVITKRI